MLDKHARLKVTATKEVKVTVADAKVTAAHARGPAVE
jgi:hypothetical protein